MTKEKDRGQEKGLYQCGWVFIGLAVVWKLLSDVFTLEIKMPPCLLYRLTGIYCPGCGGTRAVKALLEGRFARSFFCHPAVLCGAVLFFWFMLSHTVEILSKGRFKIGMKYTDAWLYLLLGIVFVQWIVKNAVKFLWGMEI